MRSTIDIRSKGPYPGNILSPMAENYFTIDGVDCRCLESFLQSLKVKDSWEQRKICRLSGKEAIAKVGKMWSWQITSRLWWRGKEMDTDSDEFQELIDKAFWTLYNDNEKYRKALKDTGGDIPVYRPERSRADRHILTEYHFIRRLMWLYRYGLQYDFEKFIPDEWRRRLPFQLDADKYEEYNGLIGDAFAEVHIHYNKEKAIELIGKARQILIDHGKAGRAESKKELKDTIDSLSKWAKDVEQMPDHDEIPDPSVARKNLDDFYDWMQRNKENKE